MNYKQFYSDTIHFRLESNLLNLMTSVVKRRRIPFNIFSDMQNYGS